MSSHLRDFGLIRSSIWQSEKFGQVRNLDARLAYIWLHTSQKTCAGVLRIGPAHMADELDFVPDVEAAKNILLELADAGLVEWFKPFVVIAKFVDATPIKTFRHAIAAFKECFSLPDGKPKQTLFQQLKLQKGTAELKAWRDKQGNPHALVFQIHRYFEKMDAEEIAKPSETHRDGFGRGSGKPIHLIKKEKREPPSGRLEQRGIPDFGTKTRAMSNRNERVASCLMRARPEPIARTKEMEQENDR